MKWRHWSILIVLALLNYLIFSAALTQLVRRQQDVHPTRTPQPTYAGVDSTAITWIVLPTNTPWPTWAPGQVLPTPASAGEITPTQPISATAEPTAEPTAAPTSLPTDQPAATPAPTATPNPPAETTIHVVKQGETLGRLAERYGVTVAAIAQANNISNPNLIYVGQRLIIPVPGQTLPTATARPAQAATPRPTKAPTHQPATATSQPKPTATKPALQFTAELVWRGDVAPNCGGPGISNISTVRDTAGNPVNGVVVRINCYDNIMDTWPSGKAGVYEAGHYDWSPGQTQPQDWTCTARVVGINGQPVSSTQEVSIHFDTNDCKPEGSGHQVAILNWVKRW